mgnify:CR=1 FL=1|jgi:hypothetical protein
MSRAVSNNGIGALYGTFDIDSTGDAFDLTSDDAGKAVVLSGNNEVDLGADAGVPAGRLEHVQDGLATVQIAGVMRLGYVAIAPVAGDSVVVDGNGAVRQAGAEEPGRGLVLSVNSSAATCDVLL